MDGEIEPIEAIHMVLDGFKLSFAGQQLADGTVWSVRGIEDFDKIYKSTGFAFKCGPCLHKARHTTDVE